MKVEPASLEAREKVGVESLMKLPWIGPAAMLATGGVVSAVNPLKAGRAGFAVRLYRRSPALPQMLQYPAKMDPGSASRHRNQNRRWMFHCVRFCRNSLKELTSRSR